MHTLTFEKIVARTKKHIFTDMSGNYSSLSKGEGYDFATLREYQYGDSVKHIDWKKSAQKMALQQRIFFAEREIDINLMALMNGSLHFGISRMKQEVVGEVASLLGYYALKNNDPFTLTLFNEALVATTYSTKQESRLQNVLKTLLTMNVIGHHIDWKEVEKYAVHVLKKSSLMFIIGDFFEVPMLEILCRKHHVVVIIVRDLFEENLDNIGTLHIKDPIGLEERRISVDHAFAKQYSQHQQIHDRNLDAYLKSSGIAYTKIYTYEDPFLKLLTLLRSL